MLPISNPSRRNAEADVEISLGAGGQSEGPSRDSAFGFGFASDPSVKPAFDAAAKVADKFGAKSIATPHLLYGILTRTLLSLTKWRLRGGTRRE